MATDVLDEHRFKSQCSLYEPTRVRSSKEQVRRPTTTTTTSSLLEPASTSAVTNNRRIKYSTQTSLSSNHSSTTNSIHSRHSASTDIISLIRSFAMKPFRTSSMTNAVAEGQTNNVISGNNVHAKPPVSLLKYRPLSDSVTDRTSYSQSTRVCI